MSIEEKIPFSSNGKHKKDPSDSRNGGKGTSRQRRYHSQIKRGKNSQKNQIKSQIPRFRSQIPRNQDSSGDNPED